MGAEKPHSETLRLRSFPIAGPALKIRRVSPS